MRQIALLLSILIAGTATAGGVYGPVSFYGNVSVGAWAAVSNIVSGATSGGTYTNGAATNYYAVCGTNLAGRLPVSSNVTVQLAGNAGTNAAALSWPRYDGILSYVILRSLDAGATWTNWLTVAASATNWTDAGTNTWTQSAFLSAYATIPGPVVPWGASGTVAAVEARVTSIEGGTSTWNQAADDAASATGSVATVSAALGSYLPYSGAASNIDLNARQLLNVGTLALTNTAGVSMIQLPSDADNRIWARGGSSAPYSVPYVALWGTNGGLYDAWAVVYSPTSIVLSTSGTLARRELVVSTSLVTVAAHILPAAHDTYDLGASNRVWRHGYFGSNSVFLGGVPLSAAKVQGYDALQTPVDASTVKNSVQDVRLNQTDLALFQLALVAKLDGAVRGLGFGQGRLWDFTDASEYTTATGLVTGASNIWWESQASSTVDLSGGCVAYWPMDDNAASTNVLDLGPSGLTGGMRGTDSNTASRHVPGKLGGALDFNGTDNWLVVPYNPAMNVSTAYTVTAWLKLDDYTAYNTIFTRYTNFAIVGSLDMALYSAERYMRMDKASSSGMGYSPAYGIHDVVNGEWGFFVWAWDQAVYDAPEVWANNILLSFAVNLFLEDESVYAEESPISIGGIGAESIFSKGAIDDVRFYSRKLSSETITQLYNGGNGISGLIATNGGPIDITSTVWNWTYGYAVSNIMVWAAVTNTYAPSNLLFEVSCDNGTNWTSVGLTEHESMPVSSAGVDVYAWNGTGTCSTAGIEIKVRCQTTNDAALRVYGVGVAVR